MGLRYNVVVRIATHHPYAGIYHEKWNADDASRRVYRRLGHPAGRCGDSCPAKPEQPALRLDNGETQFVTPPFLRKPIGAILCLVICKQQSIGDIGPTAGA